MSRGEGELQLGSKGHADINTDRNGVAADSEGRQTRCGTDKIRCCCFLCVLSLSAVTLKDKQAFSCLSAGGGQLILELVGSIMNEMHIFLL